MAGGQAAGQARRRRIGPIDGRTTVISRLLAGRGAAGAGAGCGGGAVQGAVAAACDRAAMGWQGPGPEPARCGAPSAVRAVPASFSEGFKVFVYATGRWFQVNSKSRLDGSAGTRGCACWIGSQCAGGSRGFPPAMCRRHLGNHWLVEGHLMECPLYSFLKTTVRHTGGQVQAGPACLGHRAASPAGHAANDCRVRWEPRSSASIRACVSAPSRFH